jgi:uncharacterized protein YkwD
VPAAKTLSRILPAAVAVAVLAAPSVAEAKHAKKVRAVIALGDHRPAKANAKATKKKAAKKPVKAVAAQACANTDVLPTAANLALVRAAVLCLHNQTRAAQGLPPLKENAKLDKAALGHSDDMVAEGYFDHTTPGGTNFVDRILAAGYVKRDSGWVLGENLAWGTGDLSTPDGVMTSWMNSPGHKANILKRAYREVGIGIKLGVPSDGTVGATYTLDFGAKL